MKSIRLIRMTGLCIRSVGKTIRLTHTPASSFYRRPLATELCTPFQSDYGREIFAEALTQGTMECFFPLIEQACFSCHFVDPISILSSFGHRIIPHTAGSLLSPWY